MERSKTRIYFEDNDPRKVVETTVWAVTDKSVILKRGVGIPINRIFMYCKNANHKKKLISARVFGILIFT